MQIRLDEVVNAIDETDVDTQFYYYIPEERIITKDDDSLNEKQLIPLPSHKQIDDYGTMKRFIEDLTDEEAQSWLSESIKGSGAFRRFRMTLDRFGLMERWYDYLDAAHESIAIDWCEYYGIEYLEGNEPYGNQQPFQPKQKEIVSAKHNYRFIDIDEDNVYGLVYLCSDFRKTLAKLKGNTVTADVDDMLEELRYYLKRSYPIFAIADNGKYVAYGVCRIEDDVVWLESIYVRPEYRRKGIGKMLLDKAQNIATEHGNDTLYLYVHPNNDTMLNFLKTNGYDVLNLIEVRKAYPDEQPDTSYTIGDHEYRY